MQNRNFISINYFYDPKIRSINNEKLQKFLAFLTEQKIPYVFTKQGIQITDDDVISARFALLTFKMREETEKARKGD